MGDEVSLGLLPQLGTGAALILGIIYALRVNHADRKQQAEMRKQAESRHDKVVADLRERLSELTEQLDAERRRRWKAEDAAAHYRRMAGVNDDDGD